MALTIGIYAHVAGFDDSFGGVEVFASRLAQGLAALGCDTVLHCMAAPPARSFMAGLPGRGPVDEITEGAARIRLFYPRFGPGLDGCVTENADVSRRYHEEIIFAIGTRDPFVFDVALRAGAACGTPVVSFIYNSINERIFRAQLSNRTAYQVGPATDEEYHDFLGATARQFRDIVVRSDAVVVPTDCLRGELAGLLGDEYAVNVMVSMHGVPSAQFGFRPRGEYRGSLLHLSRMMYPQALSKNYLWSCRFLRRLLDDGRSETLTMVGGGPGDEVLRAYLDHLGVAEAVNPVGAVPKQRLPEIYAGADVLLCPSMMEASCQTLVEAIMAGCVPVVLDFSGAAEVMRRLGLAEFLVSPEPGTEGEFRTVFPRMSHAMEILDEIRRDWPAAVERTRAAAGIAADQFSLDHTTRALVAELGRRGLLTTGVPALGPASR